MMAFLSPLERCGEALVSNVQIREKRRGERVFIRIPVQVSMNGANGAVIEESAETAVVSRFGALLRLENTVPKGTQLTVKHGFSHESEKFRVAWISDKPSEGRWDVGIESDSPREDFWGIRFPPERMA